MKRIITLTESEKNRILGMHKNAMINENKTFLNEVDLKQIQQLLMQKFGADALGPNKDDGKLGTYTLNAIYSALTQTQNPVGDNNQGTNNDVTNPTNSTPFQNNSQGDYFRLWLNKKDPEYAKQINLSVSGDYKDSTIQNAYQKFSAEFLKDPFVKYLSTITTSIPKCFYEFALNKDVILGIHQGQVQLVTPDDIYGDISFLADGTWKKQYSPIMSGKWWDDGKQASCDEKYCGKVNNITATNLLDLSKKIFETFKNVTGEI